MKLYSKKQRWKKILLLAGILIIGIIFWLTSILVSNVKESELEKIRFWSEAVKKKAELVRLTNIAFQELSQNETNNVYLWARACLLYTSPSPRDATLSRMPSSA